MDSSNEFFNQGWEAYENHIMFSGNPYAEDSAEGWHWGSGWEMADYFYYPEGDEGEDDEDE